MCQPHALCPLEGNAPQGSAPCLSTLSLLISWPTYLEALFSLCAEHPLTHSDCLWLPTSSPYALGILTSLGTEANILIRKEIDPFEDHQGRLCPTKSSPAAKATLCCFRPSRDRKTQKLRGQPLTIIFLLPILPFAYFSPVSQLVHVECFWLFLCLWQFLFFGSTDGVSIPCPHNRK